MNNFTQLEKNELTQIAKYTGAYTKFMSIAFYQYVEFLKEKTEGLTKILDLNIEFSEHPSTFKTYTVFLYDTYDLVIEKDYNLDAFELTQDAFNNHWDVYRTKLKLLVNGIIAKTKDVPKTLVLYTVAYPRIIMSPTTFKEQMIFGSLFGFKDSNGNFIDLDKNL